MGSSPPPKGQFLVYPSEDGQSKIEVRLEGETVWLTQQHMADLFQSTKQNVGQHLKNIFDEGELVPNSAVKNIFTAAADGADGELQNAATHKDFLSVRQKYGH